MFKVWLDFGHGGSDSGATNSHVKEKNINLIVGMEAKRLLLLNGFQVGTSRESDIFVDLSVRCNMANSWGADIFESIHHNAGGGDGAETIFSIYHGEGEKLANEIMDEFKAIGQNSRRVFCREGDKKKDYYAVIRQTAMPAVISEFGFMDTIDYEAFDAQEELLSEAKAIAKGICKHFGATWVEPIIGNGNKECIGTGIVNTNTLNLRSAPNADSTILGQFIAGDKLWFYENNNGWLRVYPDKTGWVKAGYVTIDKPVVIKPVVIPIPIVSTQLYRVRTSWEDVKGQIAAYKDLTNAKERADSSAGYKVFDKDGNIVYTPIPTPIPDLAPEVIVVPEIADADVKNILTKLLDMIKVLLGQKK